VHIIMILFGSHASLKLLPKARLYNDSLSSRSQLVRSLGDSASLGAEQCRPRCFLVGTW
jgi:hypothetical protein